MKYRAPFFGGNWKMNYGPSQTRGFVEEFVRLYQPAADRTVVFFPPAISFLEFRAAAREREDLRLGVQDVYWEPSGAFTGAISAPMARDAGAQFALAGHSERRHIFGDGDYEVARKVGAIAAEKLTSVLCVGEKLEERERGEVEDVVRRQVERGLSSLDNGAVAAAVIAYEPVWAIGTGRTASPQDATAVHTIIRALLADRVGEDSAGDIPVIYGGSVKPGNIEELLAADEVDGVLVGGASLSPADFAAICSAG